MLDTSLCLLLLAALVRIGFRTHKATRIRRVSVRVTKTRIIVTTVVVEAQISTDDCHLISTHAIGKGTQPRTRIDIIVTSSSSSTSSRCWRIIRNHLKDSCTNNTRKNSHTKTGPVLVSVSRSRWKLLRL